MKKVIFLMIDSLMPHVLRECIGQGSAPALKFFKEQGSYWDECTTVFPTMTASVDCSLITGEYPDQHKIPALIWFDPEQKRLINYMNGALPVFKLGLRQCAHDVICNLNDKHLSKNVRSIYEELRSRGRSSGSINLIARRSVNKYKVNLPFLLKLATGFSYFEDISGPDVFSLGAISRSDIQPPLPWKWDESIFGHYGISDAFAIRMLSHLIKHNILPDFTMVYLPDNDHQVHMHPKKACQILSKVDKQLQKLLNQFSSWEQALEEYVFIITGDHGQTIIGETQNYNIDLDEILSELRVARYGERIEETDELVLANNERMTYIYPLKNDVMDKIINLLAKETRIDIIAWKQGEKVFVRSGIVEGLFHFSPVGDRVDLYGRSWDVGGDLHLLDLSIDEEGTIQFGEYPDALSRLYGALFSQDIPLIACSAKPGYEFKSAYAPTHLNGGSHGSLHKVDSTIPLIVAGHHASTQTLKNPRLVDMKDYILHLLS